MATQVTDKFFEAKARLTGKVGAGGVASESATTIPHTFVGLTEGNAYIVTANRTNSTGTEKHPLNETETFIGKVSSNNFINCVRAVEGVAQAWAADTVLEILVTATGWNKLIEGILAEHNEDGTHKGTLVESLEATGEEINTGTEEGKIVTPKAIADSDIAFLDDIPDVEVTPDSITTLTNKRIDKRVVPAPDANSITPDTDDADIVKQVNTQGAGTLTINADAGTPVDGQMFLLWVKATNAQTASFNAQYVAQGTALPTSFPAGKNVRVLFQWDDTTEKWGCIGIQTQE